MKQSSPMTLAVAQEQMEHGIPRKGYVLSSAVEIIAVDLRKLAKEIEKGLSNARPFTRDLFGEVVGPSFELCSWRYASAWVVGIATGGIKPGATLANSADWLCGGVCGKKEGEFWQSLQSRTNKLLRSIEANEGLSELLPYTIDAHGPGSRLSVRRDPRTQSARTRKRAEGVFYTPPDVASFMVGAVLEGFNKSTSPTVFDPAVGTGVFLRAALRALRTRMPNGNAFELARNNLFGCDIDALALDGAASVLMHDTIEGALELGLTPIVAWRMLRANLAVQDGLALDHNAESDDCPGRSTLADLFPKGGQGFDIVIGNPPYAGIGDRADMLELARRFSTVSANPKASADLYPVFLEQMARLTRPDGAGTMVVPLSLACNSGAQFRACREFIQGTPGIWKFAFFDRQPHALFGEDVKTRNAIVVWRRQGTKSRVYTGPLRKWRGDSRRSMFATIDYTETVNEIGDGIPKIVGRRQAEAWVKLVGEKVLCSELFVDWGRSTLRDVPTGKPADVFVAPTAYNFLGIARPTRLREERSLELSTNPLHRLTCATAKDASCLYAILSSNFAFWWWHINGDGFHVNQSTLFDLPVGASAVSGPLHERLATLGEALWQDAMHSPIRSLNRGRVSYAFPPSGQREMRRAVDAILIQSLGLSVDLKDEFERFADAVVDARPFETPQIKQSGENRMPPKVTPESKEKSRVTKDEWREYTKTVWSIANKGREDHPAVFPVEIPHRLTKLFSFYGETVLDPFAGTGTTARAAIPLGRRAVCVDQNKAYVEIIKKECAALRNGHGPEFSPLEAVHGDSRNMSFLEESSVGLIVTSPPYWDKADYGTGKDNIGNVENYADFIESIRPVFEECYRVLAPGRKMCVVTANVNQHTDQGLLTFPLATDFAVLLRKIGFVMVNEIIWSKDGTGGKWGSFGAQRPIFGSYPFPPNFLFKNVHEYILIFAKPSLSKTKGPKVKPYAGLVKGLDLQSTPASPLLASYAKDAQ